MSYKIEHDKEGCIGCGACAAMNPKYWEMTGAKAKNIKSTFEKEELSINKDTAESCPVNVIHIIDENGKKII